MNISRTEVIEKDDKAEGSKDMLKVASAAIKENDEVEIDQNKNMYYVHENIHTKCVHVL
jgi:hypothetical protein